MNLEDITLEQARKNAKQKLMGGTKSHVFKGIYNETAYVLKEDKYSLFLHKLNSNLHHKRLFQFKSESDLLKALEDTGSVPKVLKSFGKHSFIMEYLDGTPLQKNIEDEKQIYGVVKSLKSIHDKGYYHGDTRTRNIIDDKFLDPQFGGPIKSKKDIFKDLLIFTYSIGYHSKKGLEIAYKAIEEIYSPKTVQELKNHKLTFFEKHNLRNYN